jgi:hypothetical protein
MESETNAKTDCFEHAVVIYPPADRQARTMFKLIMMTELENALTCTALPPSGSTSNTTSSSGTKKVAWSDRGWRRREDFFAEMESSLSDGASSLSGVVIARAQTLREAEGLVAQLAGSAPQVSVEQCSAEQADTEGVTDANASLQNESVFLVFYTFCLSS